MEWQKDDLAVSADWLMPISSSLPQGPLPCYRERGGEISVNGHVTVHFLCQRGCTWWCPGTCSNVILDVPGRALVDDNTVEVHRLRIKQIVLHNVGGLHPISEDLDGKEE